jgi:cysteine synthase
MSEEQQNGQSSEDQAENIRGGGEDFGQRQYEPPEEFAKNANCQDPEIWNKAAEDYEGFWTGIPPSPSGSSVASSTLRTTAWTTTSSRARAISRR